MFHDIGFEEFALRLVHLSVVIRPLQFLRQSVFLCPEVVYLVEHLLQTFNPLFMLRMREGRLEKMRVWEAIERYPVRDGFVFRVNLLLHPG